MENISKYETINRIYSDAVKGLIVDETILNDFKSWYKYCLDLPQREQVTYTTTLFDWQVKNGGLHQYFFNGYGIFCFSTVQNLRKIKCMRHADILEQAISIIYDNTIKPEEFLRNIFYRKLKLISSFDENVIDKFEVLDSEYYQLEEDYELFNKLENYLTE